MRPEIEEQDGVLVVRLAGELDLHTSAELRQQVERELSAGRVRALVLDLAGVTFLDSSGLGFILGRYRRMTERSGRMALSGAVPHVRSVLELSGILKILPLYGSWREGLAALRGGKG